MVSVLMSRVVPVVPQWTLDQSVDKSILALGSARCTCALPAAGLCYPVVLGESFPLVNVDFLSGLLGLFERHTAQPPSSDEKQCGHFTIVLRFLFTCNHGHAAQFMPLPIRGESDNEHI